MTLDFGLWSSVFQSHSYKALGSGFSGMNNGAQLADLAAGLRVSNVEDPASSGDLVNGQRLHDLGVWNTRFPTRRAYATSNVGL